MLVRVTLCAALAIASSGGALACTKQQARAKADAVSTRMQALAETDPERLRKLAPKVDAASMKLQAALRKNPDDLAEVCRYFDGLLADMGKG